VELSLITDGTQQYPGLGDATGHVQGVSSFNGANGAVVYVIDGGEI
jgi:hypothetical protein